MWSTIALRHYSTRRLVKCSFAVAFAAQSLLVSEADAKDMRDVSKVWTCQFPVRISGDEPVGNFFGCKEEGCGEHAYRYVKRPETYVDLRDFRVDFQNGRISYRWTSARTLRAKRSVKSRADWTDEEKKSVLSERWFQVTAPFRILSAKRVVGYEKVGDTLLYLFFERALEVIDRDYAFSGNTLTFYAGGTKVQWLRNSLHIYQGKRMSAQIAYGQCEPK